MPSKEHEEVSSDLNIAQVNMVRAASEFQSRPGGGEAYKLEVAAKEVVRVGGQLHNLFTYGDSRTFCLNRLLYAFGFTFMCPRFGLTGKGEREARKSA